MFVKPKCDLFISIFLTTTLPVSAIAKEAYIEEVVVTAQKREQRLQETPLSVSVLNYSDLESLGVTSLDGLAGSVIPSLKVTQNANSPSTLAITIRGDGSADIGQPTSEVKTAIYLDGIYLGRAQGLSMELGELERLEVLRGPQGTLYGRNSTNGAINIITKQPTGQFGIKQTLSYGNYSAIKARTHINTGELSGIKAKIDYLHSQRDGWVENTLAGQSDYNEHDSSGHRLNVAWQLTENIDLQYIHDKQDLETSHMYFQIYDDFIGTIGNERERETKTRFPLVLKPSQTDITGHSITASWKSDLLTIKSITAYRELYEDEFNNYGGANYFAGLIADENIEQEQISQEFQFLLSHNSFQWVAGLFYLKEDVYYDVQFLISLDPSFNPINPPLPVTGVTPTIADAISTAAYLQTDWEATEQLTITGGLRYTDDSKSAARAGVPADDLNSYHWDKTVAISYDINDDIMAYLRWATAYKAGGYNVRAMIFEPYGEEVNTTLEAGVKTTLIEQRLVLNAAVFQSSYDDKQFDFINPFNTTITDTLNAEKEVEITGLELDAQAVLLQGLRLGLHYTYLDQGMPPQPHPLDNSVTRFSLAQTPKHTGAILLDYTMAPLSFGQPVAHVDITSTSRYAHSTNPDSREDAYTLLNARLTINNINFANGTIDLSLWAKNLTDEEYVNLGFDVGSPIATTIQAFGTPRTYGIEASYTFD